MSCKIIKVSTIMYILALMLTAGMCTKVVVYAKDYETDSISERFAGEPDTLIHQSIQVLQNLNYQFSDIQDESKRIVTGWQSTSSNSHYMNLFNRKDYSASAGSYYQLIINFLPEGNFTRVEVATKVKSISGKLQSTKILEKKFLKSLKDYTRSPQIQITNVGVSNR